MRSTLPVMYCPKCRAELERAQIGAVGVSRDILFRNSGDAPGIRREPRFGIAVCVQSSDVSTARKILEELPDTEPEETTLDERSSKRAGVRRLAVAVRLRMPPSSA